MPARSRLLPVHVRSVRAVLAGACLLALVACATPRPDAVAVADLQPTRGNAVSGSLRFEQFGDKVHVSGEVRGLKAGSEHGFHVHEHGDCTSGDGLSAGGHYNPHGVMHGRHGQGTHHLGDLPSLLADANGVAKVDLNTTTLSLTGPVGVLGKGVVVHRDADDYKGQPAGNSGPRVACGVIRPQ